VKNEMNTINFMPLWMIVLNNMVATNMIDQNEIYSIYNLRNIPSHNIITIKKDEDFNYHLHIRSLTSHCTAMEALPKSSLMNTGYQTCTDSLDREFKLIQSDDDQNDLYSEQSYIYKNVMKQSKPYAPHYIILEDVALYGHGDLMSLDGTSHYLGVCRQYGSSDYLNINIKRANVAQFIIQPAFNLVTLFTDNYYHTLIHYLPRYLTLLQIIKSNPSIRIIKHHDHHRYNFEPFIEPILEYYGLESKSLNFINIEYEKVYFFKYLIAPLSTCNFISKNAIKLIRRAVFSMYLLNTSLEPESIVISGDIDYNGVSSSSSSSNAIDKYQGIFNNLSKIYSKYYKVIKYNTIVANQNNNDMHNVLESTIQLFSKCRIFITTSSSDNAANVMFMNRGSSVIELLSSSSNSTLIAYMSSVVGAKYFSLTLSSLLSSSSSSTTISSSWTSSLLSSSTLRGYKYDGYNTYYGIMNENDIMTLVSDILQNKFSLNRYNMKQKSNTIISHI